MGLLKTGRLFIRSLYVEGFGIWGLYSALEGLLGCRVFRAKGRARGRK